MDRRIAQEKGFLEKAERDLVAGERRVTEQAARIARLRADGHDVALAENLLTLLEETLDAWHAHHDMIVSEIARLEEERRRSRMEGGRTVNASRKRP